jgi:hypothetical protein
MRFLTTMILLVCSVSFGQSPTPDPLFQPPLAPDQVFIEEYQNFPIAIIDGVPIIGIYDGPGFNPTPDLGIQPWPTPDGSPTYSPDCCERLSRLDWMRNEYDILEERIEGEYDILAIYLHEAQGPLTPEQAHIVTSTMLRISYFESALEEYGNLIIHQAQIYSVICVECEGCQP